MHASPQSLPQHSHDSGRTGSSKSGSPKRASALFFRVVSIGNFQARAVKLDDFAAAYFGGFAGFGFAVARHQPFGNQRLRLSAAFGKSGQFQEVAQGDVFVVFEIDSGFHNVPLQKEAVIVAPAAAVPKITAKPAMYPHRLFRKSKNAV